MRSREFKHRQEVDYLELELRSATVEMRLLKIENTTCFKEELANYKTGEEGQ